MKRSLMLVLIVFSTSLLAAPKDESLSIAKGIQCTYLRERSFLETNDIYSAEKSNPDYIKKVSDGIYTQAFRICDPDNSQNADKDILAVCTTGCDQSATKGLMGIGGPSSLDIEKCKKMCQNYSDHLSIAYTSAVKGIKKMMETVPACPKAEIAPIATPVPVALPETANEAEKKE